MKLSEWRESLNIFVKYFPKGEDEGYAFSAEHDILFVHISVEDLPEDSEDGQILSKFGWHIEDGVWAKYV